MTSIIQFHNQIQSDGYPVQCVNLRDAVYDEAKHMLVVVQGSGYISEKDLRKLDAKARADERPKK